MGIDSSRLGNIFAGGEPVLQPVPSAEEEESGGGGGGPDQVGLPLEEGAGSVQGGGVGSLPDQAGGGGELLHGARHGAGGGGGDVLLSDMHGQHTLGHVCTVHYNLGPGLLRGAIRGVHGQGWSGQGAPG